jgi:hypothetical protein
MKQKLINAWNFVKWLCKDIGIFSIISSIVMVLAWTILLWPDPYGYYVAAFVLLYLMGLFLYGVWVWISHEYERYRKTKDTN